MAAPTSADGRSLVLDPVLLEKYPFGSACCTSYPAARRFSDAYRPSDALQQLKQRGESIGQGRVSLYVHLPFCETDCYFCTRHRVVARDRGQAARYLSCLEREIVTQRGAIGRDDEVAQLLWGGGTPTFLVAEETTRLWEILKRYFMFPPEGEYSIGIDPRRVEPQEIERLAALGFNRLALGVQDFDPTVQAKINRTQSIEETGHAVMAARAAGFRSVSFDLTLALPAQDAHSAAGTVEAVLRLQPDRIVLHCYADGPANSPAQRQIDSADLPSPREKARILAHAIGELLAAGYIYVGMDCFVLPEDDLALARARGAVRGDAPGDRALAGGDRLAFGVSAVSAVGDTYSQNHCVLERYCASLERGELPVFRGHRLSGDDLLRREIMRRLAGAFGFAYDEIDERFGIDFRSYFGNEREPLAELERDGLIALSAAGIEVTPRGRLFVRSVCGVFDRYRRDAPIGAADA